MRPFLITLCQQYLRRTWGRCLFQPRRCKRVQWRPRPWPPQTPSDSSSSGNTASCHTLGTSWGLGCHHHPTWDTCSHVENILYNTNTFIYVGVHLLIQQKSHTLSKQYANTWGQTPFYFYFIPTRIYKKKSSVDLQIITLHLKFRIVMFYNLVTMTKQVCFEFTEPTTQLHKAMCDKQGWM